MRAPAQEATGTSGASLAKANFEVLGWGAVENATHDVGTDLFLMARDARRFDLGLLVGAQVKSGPSWFDSPVVDEVSGILTGWWYAGDQEHFDTWLNHSIPHLLVLQNVDTKVSYWVHITQEAVRSTGKGSKIFVPSEQVVDEAHQEALLAVATSQRPPLAWEGSAWAGAQQLSHADLLRYAMVAPRLVAPHPNAGLAEVTSDQCLAMVVLVRLDELSEGRTRGAVPTMVEARGSSEWRWQLVAGLHAYLHEGDPLPLVELARAASSAPEVVAGTVAAAAALLECGRAREASKVIEAVLDRDVAVPVDHAWLQCQLARAYAETGRLLEARNLALAVQILRSEFPHDASATAIAGAAAQLVFTLSDFEHSDLAQVITAADSTAAWWRTQVLAWGLGHEADQRFLAWTGGEVTEKGLRELRAASLMSGLTGDHGGWRRSTSLLGRHGLQLTTSSSTAADVAGGLTLLRLAGDERNLSAAAAHIMLDGPADAAAAMAHDLDLSTSTRTTAEADIAFLRTVGDVVPEDDADRHVTWALDTLADPQNYREQLAPPFLLEYEALRLLRSLLRSASPLRRDAGIAHVLALPSEEDQLTAHGWAKVVRSIPAPCWTAEHAQIAADRAGQHHWELEYALLGVAGPFLPEVATRLLTEAAGGNSQAFDALGDVRFLPAKSAAALAAVAIQQIVQQRAQATAGGGYGMGGIDWAWWLTALNLCHPSEANWPAVLDHINDPLAHADHLTGALRLLAAQAIDLPAEYAPALLDAVIRLLQRPTHPWRTTNFEATAKLAMLMMQEAAGQRDDAQLFALLSGTPSDRESAALLIALRADPHQLPVLAALAYDPSPLTRSGAAEALGLWAARDVGGDHVRTLVTDLLRDPGTRLAQRVIAGLSHATDPRLIQPFENALLTHLSARVRTHTQQQLDSIRSTGNN